MSDMLPAAERLVRTGHRLIQLGIIRLGLPAWGAAHSHFRVLLHNGCCQALFPAPAAGAVEPLDVLNSAGMHFDIKPLGKLLDAVRQLPDIAGLMGRRRQFHRNVRNAVLLYDRLNHSPNALAFLVIPCPGKRPYAVVSKFPQPYDGKPYVPCPDANSENVGHDVL